MVVRPLVRAGVVTAPLEFHPLANLFPLMEGEEFAALVADIKANGLREQSWIFEGEILDGRNRYRACHEIGRDPHYMIREYRPAAHGDPLAFVLSRNLHRRHLSTQQRAAIAAELATMKPGARTDLAPNDARSAMSDAQAAEALKVSERSVERAKTRMREDPKAHEKAKAGTLPRKKPTARPKEKPVEHLVAPVVAAVRDLNVKLAPAAIEATTSLLTEEQRADLQHHLPDVIAKLQRLAGPPADAKEEFIQPPPGRSRLDLDKLEEIKRAYDLLSGVDRNAFAHWVLKHQLQQTDLAPKQKAGLAKVLEVLTTYSGDAP